MHPSIILLWVAATASAFASTPLDTTLLGGPRPGAPHPPGPPPSVPGGRPFGGWIFDTFPLLMNWTLFYYFSGVTIMMVVANMLMNHWEDKIDQEDKHLAHDAQQAAEAGPILALGDQTEPGTYGAMMEDTASPRI
ncbi:hypothetical protein BX666DRAFT_1959163 [Dichotomocladium elegans]|nr:hypothetical protein BX666DRAFT_1959163 [Dichotomocladium elegans]